jgi:itaconyl-CoA hydratase
MKPVLAFRHLDGNRYREEHGIYFDQFEVGDIIEHRPGRTVTEADNIWQSLLNLNSHPLHIDNVYARATEFGRCVVSSLVTVSIVGGMSTNGTSAKSIANLGWENIVLLAPVFVGDTLYAESEVIEMRLSKSRVGSGIVTFETRGRKEDGSFFMKFRRSALIPTSEAGSSPAKNY